MLLPTKDIAQLVQRAHKTLDQADATLAAAEAALHGITLLLAEARGIVEAFRVAVSTKPPR